MQLQQLQASATLLRIIARAAPPHERADERYFARALQQDEGRLAQRRAGWAQALGAAEPAELEGLLAAAGLDYGLRGLAEVVVADPEQLPPWAETLTRLCAGEAEGIDPHDMFGPFTALGREELRALDPGKTLLTDTALEQGLDLLRRRLLTATSQVLNYELLAMGRRPDPSQAAIGLYLQLGASLDDWLRRLELYPALAYVIATIYRNWYGSLAELIARYADDQALLARRLFGGERPGPIVELQGDAGDLHNHGRSVVLLSFAGGGRAVYKPKDLRIAAAYMELVEQLNRGGLPLGLPTRSILTRPDYAWEEFVTPAPCSEPAQIARFYTRMGMTIRLLQFLEARDFWLDNLLACGEQPVFIDLEMLLQPRMPRSTSASPAEREAQRHMEESVAYLGAIAMPTVIAAGVQAEDLGALSVKRRFLTPFKSPSAPRGGSAGAADFLDWEHPEHVPLLHDTPVDSSAYLSEILAGYSAMQACLLSNRAALLAPGSPLEQMQAFPVRFIHRDTWTNYKILQASLAPSRLRDGVRREQFLVNLIRGIEGEAPSWQERAVVRHEVADLRECDVPFFIAIPAERSVRGVDGAPIDDYFAEPAFARLQARVAELERFDLAEQRDLLASCFAIGHSPAPPPPTPEPAGEPPPWLDLAVATGDAILAQSIAVGDERAWIGMTYFPMSDSLTLDALPTDLLNGTCGLAIVFADLYRASGLERFRAAAHAALAPTLRHIDDAPLWMAAIEQQHKAGGIAPQPNGAFVGVGAALYTLARCAEALGEPALRERAHALLLTLPLPALCAIAPHDVVSGTAGLLLASLACLGDTPPPALLERAEFLAAQLLGSRRADGSLPPPPYPPEATRLDGLLDSAAGLSLGLARLRGVAPGAPMLATATMIGAQRGAAGTLLGRLALALAGANDPTLQAELDAHLAGDAAEQLTSAGLLERVELALAALALTGEPRYRGLAEAAGRALWQRRETHATWFPESFAADRHNLSAINGVGAVAHTFLRLQDPAATRSLRLLA